MKTDLLHQLWELIETAQTSQLLKASDQVLAEWLIEQLRVQYPLSAAQVEDVKAYVHSKLPLIQDMAQSQRTLCCPLP